MKKQLARKRREQQDQAKVVLLLTPDTSERIWTEISVPDGPIYNLGDYSYFNASVFSSRPRPFFNISTKEGIIKDEVSPTWRTISAIS